MSARISARSQYRYSFLVDALVEERFVLVCACVLVDVLITGSERRWLAGLRGTEVQE